jgi:hypothetical protein
MYKEFNHIGVPKPIIMSLKIYPTNIDKIAKKNIDLNMKAGLSIFKL